MSYTEYVYETSGQTLYAKALPLNTATWATGIVALTELGSTGQYSASLDENKQYFVFAQAGGSPAISDSVIGQTSPLPTKAELDAAVAVTIVPSAAAVVDRAGKNYILSYTSETKNVSITVLDAAGNAVDLSGKTLGVYWETEARASVASQTSVTIGGASNNVATFTEPEAVTESERKLIFALREQAAPKTVYAGGVYDVQYLPSS